MARHCIEAIALACLSISCGRKPAMEFGSGLDVPYIQTPEPVVRAMLELGQVARGEMVIDLGCGDGRMAVMAARDFGARSIGYDLDPTRVAEARANAQQAGVADKAHFEVRDVLAADIGRADVVVMYLIPMLIESLKPRFLSELAPGTRVVSHSFPIREWQAERTIVVEGRTLYLYRVPARAPLRVR